jgi:preprotein translocase subunit SecA
MKQLISAIKTESEVLHGKTQEELTFQIERMKKRAKTEPLENLLAEWFSLVQEVSFRQIGLRHFDTQLLAGIILHQGKIVEMKTGEGKTLASTLSVSLNALAKKGVHVVTVNDYLAERDQKWMGKIYSGLGLSSGLVKTNSSLFQKKQSYQSDITYVTNSELVFDFLRDSSTYYSQEMVQRPFHYCVIDEIDSILIDEARTPLILSTSQGKSKMKKLSLAKALAESLQKEIDFNVEEKKREVNLTEKGYQKVKQQLGKKTLYDPEDPWILEILNALKAKYVFKLNKDYIVLNNKIFIVDEFTGRVMEDRRWSLGIHEAIEMKEKVVIGGGTKTKSSITYQNFFPLYPKLAGMTGTAKTAETEFQDIYNLEVVVIPTAKPMARQDRSDLVYQTEFAKWKSVVNLAQNCFEKGQPLLIGTSSVEKSEFLSDFFRLSDLPHQVLNAKPENVARESEIVAQAGKLKAITIATNMAGRGTDIILGGNPMFAVKKQIEELLFEKKLSSSTEINQLVQEVFEQYGNERDFSQLQKEIETFPFSLEDSLVSLKTLFDKLYQEIVPLWKKDNQVVKELGGLFVLGTERHETRRIDNQLRGRAGRQGDPGISQFFVSLEDELIKIFAGESLKQWVNFLMEEKDAPLESTFLTKTLENAQKKVEAYNYDLRKNIFQYDEILNVQRSQVFQARREFFSPSFFQNFFLRCAESSFVEEYSKRKKEESQEFFVMKFEKSFDNYSFHSKNQRMVEMISILKEIWISLDLRLGESNCYQNGWVKKNRLILFFSILDFCWTEHLERMSSIRDTVNWRAYGQQNPLVEYNLEAFQSFQVMFEQMSSSMLYYSLENSFY